MLVFPSILTGIIIMPLKTHIGCGVFHFFECISEFFDVIDK